MNNQINKKVFFILLIMLLYVPLLGLRGLGEPDEGRYAEIAREMVESKDFITPRLNAVKHFHKPPLVYWMVAASLSVLGKNEFAARLPVLVFALIGIIGTYRFSKALFPEKKDLAFFSSFVLALSLQYYIWSQILCPDMILSVLMLLVFCSFWQFVQTGKGLFAVAVYLGLSFLVKGPVAFLLVFIVALVFFLVTRDREKAKKIFAPAPWLVFLIIVLPWFVTVMIKNKGLLSYFLNYHLLQRFATTAHGRSRPFYYFLGILLAGMLPWTFWTVKGLFVSRKLIFQDKRYLFLYLWIIVPLVFFSLSGSKLPGYILPVYPALSIITADVLKKDGKKWIVFGSLSAFLYASAMISAWMLEESLGENFSPRRPAEIILSNKLPGDRIASFRCFLHGLPFYVGERVVLVEKKREVQFEEHLDKGYYVEKLDEFLVMLKRQRIFCFSYEEDFEELDEKSPVPLFILWKNSGFVLFTNFEPAEEMAR
ncbi:MAG: glycosyltransferase family 39 protein [Candidatus Aureabacteria bacterium]|nr:glycosyltransferase family 39 protein [Candidatus Auribacterota bacterium]